MFICYDCKEFFRDPITKYELHTELDDGIKYEAYGACPYCGGDQIDVANSCDICGDPAIDDVCENCKEIIEETAAEIKETADKYKLNYSEFYNKVFEFLDD